MMDQENHQDSDDQATIVSRNRSDKSGKDSPGSLCGQNVGPFRILSVLGEGGMGLVYLGEQTTPIHRKVAIKVARNFSEDKDLLTRFHGERQAIAALDHPEIAKLLEVGTTDHGQPYFAMDLIEGIPLTEYCDKNSLSIHQRLHLFQKVLSAVGYAHRRGLIHRDLKPSNILVGATTNGTRLKVIDFGLAKFIENTESDSDITLDGQVSGTPRYMSPEQALGSKNRLDTRSDIFSLGVILFELLTGSTPIPEDDSKGVVEVLKEVSDFESVVPSARLSSGRHSKKNYDVSVVSEKRNSNVNALISLVRGDLDWIVAKATDRDQERRYFSCNELSADIERFLNNEPISARPPSMTYKAWKFAGKNRVAVTAGLLVTLVVLVSLFGGWYLALWALSENKAQRIATSNANLAKNEAQKLLAVAKNAKDKLGIANNRNAISFKVFVDSFRDLNPFSSGRNLSARQALKQSYANSKNVMKEDPIGQAKLFTAFARSLNGLGDNPLALKIITESLSVYEKEFGQSAAELLPARTVLQDILISKGDLQSFEDELKRTKKIIEENRLKDTFEGIKCEIQEARVKILSPDKNVTEDGIRQFTELISKFNKIEPFHHKELLAYQSEFAAAAFSVKGYRSSNKALKTILDRQIQIQGKNHPASILTNIRLLRNQTIDDTNRDSLTELELAIDGLQEVYGDTHPDLLKVRSEYAQLCLDDFQYPKAEKICLALIPKLKNSFGTESEHTLRVLQTYVAAVQKNGTKTNTLQIIKKVHHQWKSKFKNNSRDIRQSKLLLATAYSAAGNKKKSLELLTEIVDHPPKVQYGYDLVKDHALLEIYRIQLKRKSYNKAIEYGKKLLQIRPKGQPRAKANHLLGNCYLNLKKYRVSMQHFEKAAKYFQEQYEKHDTMTMGRLYANCLGSISRCQELLSDRENSFSNLTKAYQLQRILVERELPVFRTVDSIYMFRYLNRLFRYTLLDPKREVPLNFADEFQFLLTLQKKHLGEASYQTLTTGERYSGALYFHKKYDQALEHTKKYEQALLKELDQPGGKSILAVQDYHFYRIHCQERLYILQKKLGNMEQAAETHIRLVSGFKHSIDSFSKDKGLLLYLQRTLKNSRIKPFVWKQENKKLYQELTSLVQERINKLN